MIFVSIKCFIVYGHNTVLEKQNIATYACALYKYTFYHTQYEILNKIFSIWNFK